MAMAASVKRREKCGQIRVLVHTEDGAAWDEFGRELPRWVIPLIRAAGGPASLVISFSDRITVEYEIVERRRVRTSDLERICERVSLIGRSAEFDIESKHTWDLFEIYQEMIDSAESK